MNVTEETRSANPLTLVYQDDALLAVHKPAGLLVHRSPIDRHETEFALQYARSLNGGDHVYPVHRLDRPTSGLLLFARNPEIARQLGEQMMGRRVKKTYLAIVRGWPDAEGLIDYPLRDEPDDRRLKHQHQVTRDAVTGFQRLGMAELPFEVEGYPTSRYSLLALSPLTGRKHQLRRHMKHISHPIIGDANHGRGRHNRFFANHFEEARLLLAATDMALDHPVTGSACCCRWRPKRAFSGLQNTWAGQRCCAAASDRLSGSGARLVGEYFLQKVPGTGVLRVGEQL